MRILTIFGTRPEAIKLAPIIKLLDERPERFVSRVCVTAQHRELLDQALRPFNIVPHIDLDIMTAGQTLAQVTAKAVEGIDRVLKDEKPDIVLVQGDTTTAFCGALAGFYHQSKIGHVEAGLRTHNKYSPFPEEINRTFISKIADYHFAPTSHARQTLLSEGVDDRRIFVTGNTSIDALLWMSKQVTRPPDEIPSRIFEAMERFKTVLVTGHRRESFGKGFENICQAIREVADRVPESCFVYPVHLNPNVREPVNRILGNHDRIHLLDPVSYGPFVWLMHHSYMILTDSGGVQEEAPSLGKPVLVMRDTTERPEGVEAGNARVVGTQKKVIVRETVKLLSEPSEAQAMRQEANPYGDGKAADRIVEAIAKS